MDVQELFDQALEKPTPLRLQEQLAVGRRAVRRRRLASIGAGTASLAVVATVVALGQIAPRDDARSESSAASTTAVPSAPSRQSSPDGSNAALVGGESPAEYDVYGRLTLRPGWRVVQRIERPITTPVQVNGPVEAVPDGSVGLTLKKGTTTHRVLTWWASGEAGVASTVWQPADTGPRTLQDFVDIEVALLTGGPTDAVVSVSADNVMTGRNGVRVLDQRATPSLDRAGRTTAVARVRLPGAAPSYGWVLLVRSGQEVRTYPMYPVVDHDDDDPDTIDEFVSWVTPEVAEGRYP